MENISKSFITASKDSNPFPDILEFITSNPSHSLVLQACHALGIPPEQLIQKSQTEFEDSHSSKASSLLRFQHYIARRKACLSVIAQYIATQKLFEEIPSGRLDRSYSIGTRSKDKPDIVPFIPISPRQASARKLQIAKKTILKRIKVEQQQKKIQQAWDEERVVLEQNIKNKLSKSVKKENNSKFFENHDKRVQEILKKKQKEQEEHESKALNYPDSKKDEFKVFSSSIISSPRKNPLLKIENDQEIEVKLLKIHSKLYKSAERAKQQLLQKGVVGVGLTNLSNKVHHNKEELDLKQEEEKARRVFKIHQEMQESSKRREEKILNEQKKRAQSTKAIGVRHVEEQMKIELEMQEKVKGLENKEGRREQSRQNRREIIEKSAQAISSKNFIRKREQERNLQKIDKELKEARNCLIERIKESDAHGKGRMMIDYNKLRMRMEKELRKFSNSIDV